ncbi:hypothetical protein QF037_007604 [Streptomyces canus]|nr:hypothetical protein [Streptomyces canus]
MASPVRGVSAGLRRNPLGLDMVVLVLPLLRPLRIMKVYEAVRRRHGRPRLALHTRVIVYVGLSALLPSPPGCSRCSRGRTTRGPREAEPPGGLSKVFADPARDQTWTRSSTTFAIFAMASSNGMPFSCEPSR